MVLVWSSGKSLKNMPCTVFTGPDCWTVLNAKRMSRCSQIDASDDDDDGHGDVSHVYCFHGYRLVTEFGHRSRDVRWCDQSD